MKRIFLLCLLLLFLGVKAQVQRGLKGDYNTENFPELFFIWNSANPEVLEPSQFVLTENDKNIDFKFAVLPDSNIKLQKKSILFLWEDIATHKGQSDFAINLLSRFFTETTLNGNDKFNIAVFNRKKDTEKSVLQPLLQDFVDGNNKLSNTVKNHKSSNEHFKDFPLQSDLYLAINNGVDLLKKQPADHTGIIVVITAGLNIKAAGASTEMETVRQNALETGIPVYVIKYPLYGDTPEVNSLATSTYGLTSSSMEVDTALRQLQRFYNNFNSRNYGQDYKITFTTIAKRDGKMHPVHLMIDKVPQRLQSFTAPDMTFRLWVKKNLWLCIALVVVFIVIVALVIYLLLKNKKKKEAAIQANLDNLRREAEKIHQEQLTYQQKQEYEKCKAELQAAEYNLGQLMNLKNLFPRLQCRVGNENFTYNIRKPVTTLGRGADNDVVLNHYRTSNYHAEIVFTGTSFEIIEKVNTNKVIINGQFFQRATLQNGDIIGLGEAVITFYL